MISAILDVLERGIAVMRSNSRLLFVGILVFVFPLVFMWVTQSFFTTAYDNIDTAEKRRVGMMHDTLATVLRDFENPAEQADSLIETYATENQDITKIRIVTRDAEGFRIIRALNENIEGNLEKTDQLYRTLPLSGAEDSFIYESVIDGVRTWQVFRSVERGEQEFFIFSEHTFGLLDSVMASRRQQSYLGLTLIFVFLIGLAYWLNRQEEWEKHHRVLERQLKERDLFSNMIAHEFRSPLTAIKGYASFLQESETLTSEEKRFATNIRGSAERLVLLVNDFLEVARLQSGKMTVERETVDMRDILARVAEDLGPLAKEKGLTLTYTRPKQPVHFETDPERMMQVMINIVTNAIKYTDSGDVTLECTRGRRELTVRVKDTGMGISAEDQKKLFAPFTRVGGVDASSTTGTGLGMWITKQLVALLGGDIGVESIKGVGTHVVITFKE